MYMVIIMVKKVAKLEFIQDKQLINSKIQL
jgi:hypothetical protein